MLQEFFNTLGHKTEPFQSLNSDKVRFYACGPTVYNYVHIGNLRSYIFADLVKRSLVFNGHNIEWVMNITDVDDKTVKNTLAKTGANANTEDLKKETDFYFRTFLKDLDKVNINKDEIRFVKVSDVITQIQEYILELIKKGYAYKADDGSVYFSIEKYQNDIGDYGSLVGEKFLEGKKIGARVNVDEYDKENLSDFALWKAKDSEDGEIFWTHPELGPGRPGWHIECTVINHEEFPQGTDIHSGGIDLKFPHHTNEIAQAQAYYKPFVKYWLHCDHIHVNAQKMAKSAGNFLTLRDVEERGLGDGLTLRYLYLQSHYRSKLNINEESLLSAAAGLKNLKNKVTKLKEIASNYRASDPDENAISEFKMAINKDLNTAEGLAVLQKVLDSTLKPEIKLQTLLKMDEVLGLKLESSESTVVDINDLSPQIKNLVEERNHARANKDFALADKLREKLNDAGYEVLDTAEKTEIRRI